MDDVAHVSLESVRSVYPSLTKLQCIVELENFGKSINRLVSCCSKVKGYVNVMSRLMRIASRSAI